MSRLQRLVVGLSVVLFLALYFGASTNPKSQKSINENRALKAAEISPQRLLEKARQTASPQNLALIASIEMELDSAEGTDQQVLVLKSISGAWYNFGFPALSASYAEEIANMQPSDSAWAIAGATYFAAFRFDADEQVREHSHKKAIQCFENAVSLDPENPEHRVNLGLCYVEGSKEPMKGILMIRDLLESYPDNVLVLYTLGRLSIESSQFDKAVERLSRVIELDPGHPQGNILLARSLESEGDSTAAILVLENALKHVKEGNFRDQIQNRLNELKK